MHSQTNTCSAWTLFCVSIHITPGSNSQNTVQDMSAGHSQTDRCASSELSKTHSEKSQYKLARPDLFTLIDVERI